MNPLTRSLVAVVALAGCAGCGAQSRETRLSAAGLSSLFEAECFDWRSFPTAKREYERDRFECNGEITRRSIEDCQSNVVAEDWKVRTDRPSIDLNVEYVFGETVHPRKSETFCSISAPDGFKSEISQAAVVVASKRRLRGPYRSGDKGFRMATLEQYWVDNSGRPAIGIFHFPAVVGAKNDKDSSYPWKLARLSSKLK